MTADGLRSLFWLSFCDTERPKGQQFLGVVMVRAPTLLEAIKAAWALEINPGGAIESHHLPDGKTHAGAEVPEKWIGRLLSKPEVDAYNEEQEALNKRAQEEEK